MTLLLDTIEISEKALTEKGFLLLTPHPYLRRAANELAAWLAAKGDVFVLDGGNSFDAYGIIRVMARRSKSQLSLYLPRIHVARSFTCYQTLTLCTQAKHSGYPALVLNLTATFRDENVLYEERSFLFQACLEELLELQWRVPLVLLESAGCLKSDSVWVAQLKQTVHQVFYLEQPSAAQQPTLF